MNDSSFDKQLATLIAAGFAEAAGFEAAVEPLRDVFAGAAAGDLPPTLVVTAELVGAERLVAAIDRHDGKPQTVIHAEDLAAYRPRDGIELPAAPAYVLGGISRQQDTRGVPPVEALKTIETAGRQPLTIEEGLAIWRMHEAAVGPGDGLSLAASTRGDKRVPAIWISKHAPKLGWCFAGVPHTWLATASCTERLAA